MTLAAPVGTPIRPEDTICGISTSGTRLVAISEVLTTAEINSPTATPTMPVKGHHQELRDAQRNPGIENPMAPVRVSTMSTSFKVPKSNTHCAPTMTDKVATFSSRHTERIQD